MPTEVTWRSPATVSGLHAAEAIGRRQTLADARLAEAIRIPAMQLAAEISAVNLPGERFWRHLIPLAGKIEGRRAFVEAAVAKLIGRGGRFDQVVSNLAAHVAAVEAAMKLALPDLANELALRERPLREQWEGRGPGLLQQLGWLTEEQLIVPECEVLLVYPALGGAGEPHLAYNSVRIEGVLANPVADVPEVARLAWLIAQLHLDLPIYSERIHADRFPHIARFAMLPAALAAAENVELLRFTPETVRSAIAAWRLSVPKGVDAAMLIMEWWQTYRDARPPWNVALEALNEMFG
jgi:hypothetical protein